MILSYRDLEVWQKSIDLVVDCYKMSERFPKSETYGLVSQLRRAAVSVAYGSLTELETHLFIASRLTYLDRTSLKAILDKSAEIGRMLNGLMRSLNRQTAKVPKP